MSKLRWKWEIDALERERRRKKGKRVKLSRETKKVPWGQARKFKALARKFKCYVCDTGAKRPDFKVTATDAWGEISSTKADWSKPGDLSRCKSCNNWTCYRCFHRGICKICWGIKHRKLIL